MSALFLVSPTEMCSVKQVMRGIRRTIGGTAQTSKAPLTVERLMSLLEHCQSDLVGLGDHGVLFIGYAGGFRHIFKGGRVSDKALRVQGVALIVKKYAKKADLVAGEFAEHSLRSGFLTSAAEREVRREKIKAVTGHNSMQA